MSCNAFHCCFLSLEENAHYTNYVDLRGVTECQLFQMMSYLKNAQVD